MAASFISAEVFARWKKRHPGWRVLSGADDLAEGEPMSQVPAVRVAGQTAGPVWFVWRSERATKRLQQLAGHRVDGALGGSLLKDFRLSINYPEGQIRIEASKTNQP